MSRLYFVIFLCFLLLSSCNDPNQFKFKRWKETHDKLKVLCTTSMICNLVEEVGGDNVAIIVLIKGELDPHSYQLVKGDDEKLQLADLIFYNGLGLEHGPSLKKQLRENEKAIPVGDLVADKFPDQILHYNGQLDPHIWMNVSLWKETIPFILEALIAKDPNHEFDYRKNANQLIKKMNEQHELVKKILSSVPDSKRYLVTSHDAFNYFAKTYLATQEEIRTDSWHDRFQAPEGLAPESQIGTNDIRMIIDHLVKFKINVLFPESNVSKASLRKILEAGNESGLQLTLSSTPLYGDAMGPEGSSGDSYLKMIEHNARTIANTLMNKEKK